MSMKAVVFRGPFDIAVEDHPRPKILDPTDAIVRVRYAGICGSELHMYRGHQKTGTRHIMGHEFVGVVEEVGSDVSLFSSGDEVVSIFSAVCMKCWFCRRGLTNRCVQGTAFGTQLLDGGQAEYARVPFADGTLQPVPSDLDRRLLIMMCDIFPTGYYAASQAIQSLKTQSESRLTTLKESVVVCLGCGPVGICAIVTARSKGVGTIFAIDGVVDRLKEAENLGAIPLLLGRDDVKARVLAATENRGADAVIELVGNTSALQSAFELLRPCGVLSSIGFHQGSLPFTGLDCYLKNINAHFGRVPVRTVFHDALQCLRENQAQLKDYITHELPLSEAAVGYHLFEQRKARKVILRVSE
ncbi:GroES-like protein [Aspergillus sclerotiicarbonarius CBS 121057]|uniref:GroES-like protein n=1 Tax=Aspergillus sclerotiicarbonarius (strain CBS 121057 / IBT 28362) TaxID=1448318 RepID=A0A319DUZ4_ASPSB|nr:GroES-like protein [Aspergillus sclerotiicarbonarius CBS 121057]